jgi:hypothetical protein
MHAWAPNDGESSIRDGRSLPFYQQIQLLHACLGGSDCFRVDLRVGQHVSGCSSTFFRSRLNTMELKFLMSFKDSSICLRLIASTIVYKMEIEKDYTFYYFLYKLCSLMYLDAAGSDI